MYQLTVEPYLLMLCCFYLIAGFSLFILVQTLLHIPPYVPSRLKNIKKVMEEIGIGPGTKFIDLGSGDGRIVFLARSLGAEATGIDINPYLIFFCRFLNFFRRRKAKFILGSYGKHDLSGYNAVFIYLFPEVALRLEEKIFSELPKGSVVIVNTFDFKRKADGKMGEVSWYMV